MVAGVTLGTASFSISRSYSGGWGRGDYGCGYSRVEVALNIRDPGAHFTEESLHEQYEEVKYAYDPGDNLSSTGGRLDRVS